MVWIKWRNVSYSRILHFFDKLVKSLQYSKIITKSLNQQTTIIISSSKVLSIVTLVSQCRVFSPGDTLISGKFSRSLSFKEQHRHVDQGRVVGTPSSWQGSCRWWTWSGKFMKVQALKRTKIFWQIQHYSLWGVMVTLLKMHSL